MFRNLWELRHRDFFEKKKDFLFCLVLHSETTSEVLLLLLSPPCHFPKWKIFFFFLKWFLKDVTPWGTFLKTSITVRIKSKLSSRVHKVLRSCSPPLQASPLSLPASQPAQVIIPTSASGPVGSLFPEIPVLVATVPWDTVQMSPSESHSKIPLFRVCLQEGR